MNTKEARWAQIVFWDLDDVKKLHKQETWLAERLQPNNEPRYKTKGIDSWMSLSWTEKMQAKYELVPYWDRKIEEPLRTSRMDIFLRDIFPIWAGIESKAGEDESEVNVIHRCDIAIFHSGRKPARFLAQG